MSQTFDIVRPESVGLSSARLARLHAHFAERFVGPGKVPGVLTLVARRGQVAHVAVSGLADREAGAPLRQDSLFRIYSMTKPLTSVLFMMLVEEGKVALDDPVAGLIPSWSNLGVYQSGELGGFFSRPADRPMMMVDLLRHTAGLTYGFQNRTPVDAAYRDLAIGVMGPDDLSLPGAIEALARLPLEFSPGDFWNYSLATDVLGHLIGLIEGQPFEQVMKARLIDPLAMVDTDFQVRPDQAHRLAACYAAAQNGDASLYDAPGTSPFLAPPRFVSGGGGLVSTAADYLRFCQMLLNGGCLDGVRYISPKTLQLMTANHLPGATALPGEYLPAMYAEGSCLDPGFPARRRMGSAGGWLSGRYGRGAGLR